MDPNYITEFLIGSFAHVISLIPVLFEIWWSKDCTGISAKTQILHAIVLFTRATLMPDGSRVFVCWLTICTLYSIYCHRKPEHEKHDDVRIERIIIPCLIVAFFIRHDVTYVEYFISATTFIEALAIIPQTRIIQRACHFEAIMYYYVGVLSCAKLYQGFVLIMKFKEEGVLDQILVAATIVQLFFYVDFFITHLGHIKEIEREADEEEARIFGIGGPSGNVVESVKVVDEKTEKKEAEKVAEKVAEKEEELKEVKCVTGDVERWAVSSPLEHQRNSVALLSRCKVHTLHLLRGQRTAEQPPQLVPDKCEAQVVDDKKVTIATPD